MPRPLPRIFSVFLIVGQIANPVLAGVRPSSLAPRNHLIFRDARRMSEEAVTPFLLSPLHHLLKSTLFYGPIVLGSRRAWAAIWSLRRKGRLTFVDWHWTLAWNAGGTGFLSEQEIDLQFRTLGMLAEVRRWYRPVLRAMVEDVLSPVLRPGQLVLELGSGGGELRALAGEIPARGRTTWVESDIDSRFHERPNPYEAQRAVLSLPDLKGLDRQLSRKPDLILALSLMHLFPHDMLEASMRGIAKALAPGGSAIHLLDRPADPLVELASSNEVEHLIPYPIALSPEKIIYGGLLVDGDLLHRKIKRWDMSQTRLSKLMVCMNYMQTLRHFSQFDPEMLDLFALILRSLGVVKRDYENLWERLGERMSAAAKAARLDVVRSEILERRLLIPRELAPEIPPDANVIDAKDWWISLGFDAKMAKRHPGMIRLEQRLHVFEVKHRTQERLQLAA